MDIFKNSLLEKSRVFFAIKFQVISRFCPGLNGYSLGFSADTCATKKADAKGILKLQPYKT